MSIYRAKLLDSARYRTEFPTTNPL